MKIALLHDSVLPPKTYGGIERIVMALAADYTRRGHKVVIASRSGSEIQDYEWVELPKDLETRDAKEFLPSDVDFLHSHQPLPTRPSLPFLVTIHGNGHPGEKYYSNTNFLSQSHARNHSAKYIVYNGVDPSHYPFVERKEDYYVFLARTTWRVKNVKTAIQWAQDLGVRLEIMGGSGISRGKVHYNGLVEEPEKLKLISKARALIYPTNWDEPCAAAPLEALACGTPVIGTRNGCMPELVRPGTGVLCSTYPELLSAAAQARNINPHACRKIIETEFSLSRMADNYLKLIQKILEVGELDQQPQYNFNPASVKLLYKPTLKNRLQLMFTGKV